MSLSCRWNVDLQGSLHALLIGDCWRPSVIYMYMSVCVNVRVHVKQKKSIM
jgi:hypothetical protein